MTTVGQKERATQNRVIKLFRERLDYTYLGNWEGEERAMASGTAPSRPRRTTISPGKKRTRPTIRKRMTGI